MKIHVIQRHVILGDRLTRTKKGCKSKQGRYTRNKNIIFDYFFMVVVQTHGLMLPSIHNHNYHKITMISIICDTVVQQHSLLDAFTNH